MAANELGQFTAVLLAEHITLEDAPDLTLDELKELGVPLGPRKKIVKLFAPGGAAGGTATAAAPPAAPGSAAAADDDPCDTAAKFSAGRTMIVGEPATAAHGLLAALGVAQGGPHHVRIMSNGVAEITREFTTLGEHCNEMDKGRFEYIFGQSATLLEQDNGVKRDVGHEGMMLEDFLKQQDARKAKLTTAHVLALRLYTSNSYGRINWPLRGGCTEANPHPYAATTFYIHDGIMKLRANRAGDATAVRTFWRGMSGTTVSDGFMKRGGTEMGCMSTIETQTVARTFAKVGEVDHPLLRRANRVCQQLPAVDSAAFDATFRRDLTDAVTASFLGAATKTSSALGEVSELYSLLFNDKTRQRDRDREGTGMY